MRRHLTCLVCVLVWTRLATPNRACLLIAAAALSLACTGPRSAWAQSAADAVAATASSEWGTGYGAEAAADGIVNENGNYWQTVASKDRGAWWQADLGQIVPVRGIQVAWARYEDKYHAPPASVIVQISDTGGDGPWKDVLTIGADKIPADEAPFESDRSWAYPFPEAASGRFVRLFFPEGDQPQAKYDGYICLGEVQIDAPGLAPQLVSIEGVFGKVEVNVTRPSWTRLYLRGPGELGRESLLATNGRRPWARGAYTYVVAEDGKRYESRLAKPDKTEVVPEGDRNVLHLTGVKLVSGADQPPVAIEDWTISAPGDGSQLVWQITRRWQCDFTSVCSGSPGLFFSFDARHRQNSTTSTLWYDPLRIAASESKLYDLVPMPGRISENHVQTIRDRDTWAIYKLWTNWNAPADLRLDVEGGHLYRRGSYAVLSEAGAVTAPGLRHCHHAGETEQITIRIGSSPKQATGYQLAITLPDKETETALKQFYDAVFNGGAVNDQKGFDFGNETDGWYYAGSCWMYGATLAAGTPAAGPLSAHPYDAARAFREHLAHVLSTLDEQGRARFGYNQGGEWVDDNLHTIIGTRFYLLHSGDLHFVRQCLPALERMLAYFVQRRDSNGLFKLDDVGAHWYYDAITTSGTNGYYNAFFYKAACDLAEMERAAGRHEQAREYGELAASIKAAFNRVFWKEDAPGGPRYLDWIDAQGKEVSYFCDLCQWPPIAVGIASPEQARKIVATANARIAELEKEYGYAGYAGLSALWPVPQQSEPTRLADVRAVHERRQPAVSDVLGDRRSLPGRRRRGRGEATEAVRTASRRDALGWRQRRQHPRRDGQRRRRAVSGRHGGRHRRGRPRRAGDRTHLGAAHGNAASASRLAPGRGRRAVQGPPASCRHRKRNVANPAAGASPQLAASVGHGLQSAQDRQRAGANDERGFPRALWRADHARRGRGVRHVSEPGPRLGRAGQHSGADRRCRIERRRSLGHDRDLRRRIQDHCFRKQDSGAGRRERVCLDGRTGSRTSRAF